MVTMPMVVTIPMVMTRNLTPIKILTPTKITMKATTIRSLGMTARTVSGGELLA